MNDLRKKDKVTVLDRIDAFAMKYAHIIFPAAIILLLILISLVVVALFQNVSAVESGSYYYKMQSII
jgi:hypothetical protein